MRAAAARSLGQIGDDAAIGGLVQATRDQDQRVRVAAIAAIGDIKSRGVAPVLRQLLGDEASAIRAAALAALAEVDPEEAFELLIRATEDTDPGVRKSAWGSLDAYTAPHAKDRVQRTREHRLARLPEILEERILEVGAIIQREGLDVLQLGTEPGLFELWEAIPGERFQASAAS